MKQVQIATRLHPAQLQTTTLLLQRRDALVSSGSRLRRSRAVTSQEKETGLLGLTQQTLDSFE